MTTQKLEQVLEYLVNEENEKATDLLHEVFVEKAKTIYSDLVESDADIEDDITEEAKDEDEAWEKFYKKFAIELDCFGAGYWIGEVDNE